MNAKETYEDKFARKYWCKRAKRSYTQFVKRRNRRKLRQLKKKECFVTEREED